MKLLDKAIADATDAEFSWIRINREINRSIEMFGWCHAAAVPTKIAEARRQPSELDDAPGAGPRV